MYLIIPSLLPLFVYFFVPPSLFQPSILFNCFVYIYIAHGVQFLQMVDLNHFAGLIFADARTHAHYVQSNILCRFIFGGEAVICKTCHAFCNGLMSTRTFYMYSN